MLDPDPHFGCRSGSRRRIFCGSMRIRVINTGTRTASSGSGSRIILKYFYFEHILKVKYVLMFGWPMNEAETRKPGTKGRYHILISKVWVTPCLVLPRLTGMVQRLGQRRPRNIAHSAFWNNQKALSKNVTYFLQLLFLQMDPISIHLHVFVQIWIEAWYDTVPLKCQLK